MNRPGVEPNDDESDRFYHGFRRKRRRPKKILAGNEMKSEKKCVEANANECIITRGAAPTQSFSTTGTQLGGCFPCSLTPCQAPYARFDALFLSTFPTLSKSSHILTKSESLDLLP